MNSWCDWQLSVCERQLSEWWGDWLSEQHRTVFLLCLATLWTYANFIDIVRECEHTQTHTEIRSFLSFYSLFFEGLVTNLKSASLVHITFLELPRYIEVTRSVFRHYSIILGNYMFLHYVLCCYKLNVSLLHVFFCLFFSHVAWFSVILCKLARSMLRVSTLQYVTPHAPCVTLRALVVVPCYWLLRAWR